MSSIQLSIAMTCTLARTKAAWRTTSWHFTSKQPQKRPEHGTLTTLIRNTVDDRDGCQLFALLLPLGPIRPSKRQRVICWLLRRKVHHPLGALSGWCFNSRTGIALRRGCTLELKTTNCTFSDTKSPSEHHSIYKYAPTPCGILSNAFQVLKCEKTGVFFVCVSALIFLMQPLVWCVQNIITR